MTQLNFTKMHGLGNDFIVINAIEQPFTLTPQQIQHLSDRHRGIGFDQCLVLEASADPDTDFTYRIFNADGAEVGQCGNGARCVAWYCHQHKLTQKNPILFKTATGLLSAQILQDEWVKVDMGVMQFNHADIPDTRTDPLSLNNLNFHTAWIGNPHAVAFVDDVGAQPLAEIATALQQLHPFLNGVNVGLMQRIDDTHIKLRVYERGVGETLACGSGAVAAGVIAMCYFNYDSALNIELPGGTCEITWVDETHPAYLTGPAKTVFEGVLPTK